MQFAELPAYQAWPLEKKIDWAGGWIRQGFAASRHHQAIAFSGGKDSTVAAAPITFYAPGHKTSKEYREVARELVAEGIVA